MTIGSMFGDIIKAFFSKPVTEKYPFFKKISPINLRGQLHWDPEKCTGCLLCIKDCPTEAIELLVLDKPSKRFVLRYNVDKCTFCAQCVVNCRFNCIELSDEQWELASNTKEPFKVYYGRDEDIQFFLAGSANGGPEKVNQEN